MPGWSTPLATCWTIFPDQRSFNGRQRSLVSLCSRCSCVSHFLSLYSPLFHRSILFANFAPQHFVCKFCTERHVMHHLTAAKNSARPWSRNQRAANFSEAHAAVLLQTRHQHGLQKPCAPVAGATLVRAAQPQKDFRFRNLTQRARMKSHAPPALPWSKVPLDSNFQSRSIY